MLLLEVFTKRRSPLLVFGAWEPKSVMTDKDSMYVVKFGNSYKYTIPGFSVITVQLRHAKIQKIYNGELKLFDVFFNEEVTIGMHLPTGVVPTDSCYIEVR